MGSLVLEGLDVGKGAWVLDGGWSTVLKFCFLCFGGWFFAVLAEGAPRGRRGLGPLPEPFA